MPVRARQINHQTQGRARSCPLTASDPPLPVSTRLASFIMPGGGAVRFNEQAETIEPAGPTKSDGVDGQSQSDVSPKLTFLPPSLARPQS